MQVLLGQRVATGGSCSSVGEHEGPTWQAVGYRRHSLIDAADDGHADPVEDFKVGDRVWARPETNPNGPVRN
jgi:hypothetical protein